MTLLYFKTLISLFCIYTIVDNLLWANGWFPGTLLWALILS